MKARVLALLLPLSHARPLEVLTGVRPQLLAFQQALKASDLRLVIAGYLLCLLFLLGLLAFFRRSESKAEPAPREAALPGEGPRGADAAVLEAAEERGRSVFRSQPAEEFSEGVRRRGRRCCSRSRSGSPERVLHAFGSAGHSGSPERGREYTSSYPPRDENRSQQATLMLLTPQGPMAAADEALSMPAVDSEPFRAGDAVSLWSSSANKWWDDAVVVDVGQEHFKVRFDGGFSTKLVPVGLVKDVLRRRASQACLPTAHVGPCQDASPEALKTPMSCFAKASPEASKTPMSTNFAEASPDALNTPMSYFAKASPEASKTLMSSYFAEASPDALKTPMSYFAKASPEASKTPMSFAEASPDALKTPMSYFAKASPEASKTPMSTNFAEATPEPLKMPVSTYRAASSPSYASVQHSPAAAYPGYAHPQALLHHMSHAPAAVRRYLPRFLKGVEVITALGEPGKFAVNNFALQATTRGVAYRLSMNMQDVDPDKSMTALWGTVVKGEIVDDWVQVHF